MIKNIIKTFLIILTLQLTLQSSEINIDKIIKKAKKIDKHLLIWLHKTDCGYCENMREFTLNNNTIKAFISKNFIFLDINIYNKNIVKYKGFSGNTHEFAKKMGYDFYPTTLFFDDKKEIIFAEVGYIDNNSMPNEKRFFSILNFISSNSYKKMDYEDYIFDIGEEL